jgi:hypothetical protein
MTENRVAQNMAFPEDDSAGASEDNRVAQFVNRHLQHVRSSYISIFSYVEIAC